MTKNTSTRFGRACLWFFYVTQFQFQIFGPGTASRSSSGFKDVPPAWQLFDNLMHFLHFLLHNGDLSAPLSGQIMMRYFPQPGGGSTGARKTAFFRLIHSSESISVTHNAPVLKAGLKVSLCKHPDPHTTQQEDWESGRCAGEETSGGSGANS